jgi:hypothetical protein
MKGFAVSLLLTLLPFAALARGFVSHEWDGLKEIPTPYDGSPAEQHMAYVSGYIDAVASSAEGRIWCPADSLLPIQTHFIVATYLKKNVARPGDTAIQMVYRALSARYPCKGG